MHSATILWVRDAIVVLLSVERGFEWYKPPQDVLLNIYCQYDEINHVAAVIHCPLATPIQLPSSSHGLETWGCSNSPIFLNLDVAACGCCERSKPLYQRPKDLSWCHMTTSGFCRGATVPLYSYTTTSSSLCKVCQEPEPQNTLCSGIYCVWFYPCFQADCE